MVVSGKSGLEKGVGARRGWGPGPPPPLLITLIILMTLTNPCDGACPSGADGALIVTLSNSEPTSDPNSELTSELTY